MGMFDILIVEVPLPDAGAAEVREWHTKDFADPFMENYKITADGRLLHERIHLEDRSDPQYSIGSNKRFVGCSTRIHEGWDDVHFHGILSFQGDENSGETRLISFTADGVGKDLFHPEPAEWFEYKAKFTDGQLVSIERVGARQVETNPIATSATGGETRQQLERDTATNFAGLSQEAIAEEDTLAGQAKEARELPRKANFTE